LLVFDQRDKGRSGEGRTRRDQDKERRTRRGEEVSKGEGGIRRRRRDLPVFHPRKVSEMLQGF
jgi:hypothetical protein